MSYYYSPSLNGFFPQLLRPNYELAGSWPNDARAVSDETFFNFGASVPPAGMVRAPDNDGNPAWRELPGAPVKERRRIVKLAIDQTAGDARSRFVSPGDLVDQEYREAEAQAQAFRDAGFFGAAPPMVQCWADASGMSPQAAAEDILFAAQNMRAVLESVRTLRLAGKAAVDAAPESEIEVVAQTFIDQLNAMKP